MSKNYLKPFIPSGYSWPFSFNARTRHIENKLQGWCMTVRDVNQPIRLSKKDYDELMKTLSKDFLPIGTPMYNGRNIYRTGEIK